MSEFLGIVFGRSEKQMTLGEFIVHPISLEEKILNREELQLGGLQLEDLLVIMKKEVENWMKRSGVTEIGRNDAEVAKL